MSPGKWSKCMRFESEKIYLHIIKRHQMYYRITEFAQFIFTLLSSPPLTSHRKLVDTEIIFVFAIKKPYLLLSFLEWTSVYLRKRFAWSSICTP